MNFGLAWAVGQAARKRLKKIGGRNLSLASLRFGSSKHLTGQGGDRHATKRPTQRRRDARARRKVDFIDQKRFHSLLLRAFAALR
jgi:hypothetical protein